MCECPTPSCSLRSKPGRQSSQPAQSQQAAGSVRNGGVPGGTEVGAPSLGAAPVQGGGSGRRPRGSGHQPLESPPAMSDPGAPRLPGAGRGKGHVSQSVSPSLGLLCVRARRGPGVGRVALERNMGAFQDGHLPPVRALRAGWGAEEPNCNLARSPLPSRTSVSRLWNESGTDVLHASSAPVR